mmetsp:Transcript_95368/g.189042  ORF Transcript_95368/g.189042 Transcript_95368/m.189042 type:complete len:227 (+) Transcript_95368:510-1190(+)
MLETDARLRSSRNSQCRANARGTCRHKCGQPEISKQRKRLNFRTHAAIPSAVMLSPFNASDKACKLGFARQIAKMPSSVRPGQAASSKCISTVQPPGWARTSRSAPVTAGENERSSNSRFWRLRKEWIKRDVTAVHLAAWSLRNLPRFAIECSKCVTQRQSRKSSDCRFGVAARSAAAAASVTMVLRRQSSRSFGSEKVTPHNASSEYERWSPRSRYSTSGEVANN